MAVHVSSHSPDLANPEPFWWWYCDCGQGAPKEYADQAGAEIGAEDHRQIEHPDDPPVVGPITRLLREAQ